MKKQYLIDAIKYIYKEAAIKYFAILGFFELAFSLIAFLLGKKQIAEDGIHCFLGLAIFVSIMSILVFREFFLKVRNGEIEKYRIIKSKKR